MTLLAVAGLSRRAAMISKNDLVVMTALAMLGVVVLALIAGWITTKGLLWLHSLAG